MTARLWHWLDQLGGGGGILAYHGVTEGDPPSPAMHVSIRTLELHWTFVRERYRVIALAEFLSRLAQGRSVRGCVAITFDDAYAGIARLAAPLLREFDFPATIFVAVGPAMTGARYWWDIVEDSRSAECAELWLDILGRVDLPALPRDAASMTVLRDRVLTRFRGRLVCSTADTQGLPEDLRSLNFAELGRLAADDRFDFGCHTLSHAALPFLSLAEQESEIRRSYRALVGRLPRVRPFVAYPYGLYDRRTIQAAHCAGMRAGLSIEGRTPGRRQDLMTVPRVGAGEAHSVRSIASRLSAAARPLLILRQRGAHPHLPVDSRLRSSVQFNTGEPCSAVQSY